MSANTSRRSSRSRPRGNRAAGGTSADAAGASGKARPATLPATSNEVGWNIPLPKGIRPRINSPSGAAFSNLADEETRYTQDSPTAQSARNRRVSESALRSAQIRRDGIRLDADDQQDNEQPDDVDELGNEDQFADDDVDDNDTDVRVNELDEAEILRLAEDIRARRQPQGTPRQRRLAATREVEAMQFDLPAADVERDEPRPHGLHLRHMVIEDTDRMWDWIRGDSDKGKAFFSRPLSNSQELHDLVKGLLLAESKQVGIVRAIYFNDRNNDEHHIGTAMVIPILSIERVALVHLYLSKAVRGDLPKLLPWLLDQTAVVLPGYMIGVWAHEDSHRNGLRRLLSGLGFAEQTLFVR